MNVTHVIFNLYTGGTELLLLDIIDQQLKQGANVSLVVINTGHDAEVLERIPRDARTIFVGRPVGSKNPWWFVKYNLAVASTHPDVVHFHNDKAVGYTMRRKGVRYVGTVHTTRVPFKYYPRLDKVFSISQSVQRAVDEAYGAKTTVVYNGIDCDAYAKKQAVDDANVFKIVQVGRLLHESKGQHLLLQAVASLPEDLRQKATLTFIGSGPSEAYLRDLATSLGLEGQTEFKGALPRGEVAATLRDYDLFVQPSIYEGFGLTVAEAMASKVPVLVSGIEGPMEVIGQGKYGMYFSTGDALALRDRIAEAMSGYGRLLERARGEAYAFVTEHFDISATARNYLNNY